jgi:release factor glutamine methyltransferase
MTYHQALQWAKQILAQGESPAIDARRLLCHVLQCEPVTLMTYPEKLLSEESLNRYKELVVLREKGNPVAYLIGYRDFWDLRLTVSEKTLIPRPETELLVELVLALELPDNANVIDLGTGTGAIALALGLEKPNWQILGVDFDTAIVELAENNRLSNNIGDNVSFQQSDWFKNVDDQAFDLIVTNPPYVEPDSGYLEQGDLRFEPNTALVALDDGFADIKTIIEKSLTRLNINSWLLVEHGFEQGKLIRDILQGEGFMNVKTISDLNDCERITQAQWCQ